MKKHGTENLIIFSVASLDRDLLTNLSNFLRPIALHLDVNQIAVHLRQRLFLIVPLFVCNRHAL